MRLGFYILTFVFCGTGFITAQDNGKNRVLKLEELSQTEIDKLDRNKSVFILTFGNLEEHGPHLPVGTDYFEAIAVRDAMVRKLLRSRPDYTFVLVPVVPLGEGGANDNMLELDHIGTFAVRYDTLRNVILKTACWYRCGTRASLPLDMKNCGARAMRINFWPYVYGVIAA